MFHCFNAVKILIDWFNEVIGWLKGPSILDKLQQWTKKKTRSNAHIKTERKKNIICHLVCVILYGKLTMNYHMASIFVWFMFVMCVRVVFFPSSLHTRLSLRIVNYASRRLLYIEMRVEPAIPCLLFNVYIPWNSCEQMSKQRLYSG